jgi:hypothetical protein
MRLTVRKNFLKRLERAGIAAVDDTGILRFMTENRYMTLLPNGSLAAFRVATHPPGLTGEAAGVSE